MPAVTHAFLISGQLLAFGAYTVASYRLFRTRFGCPTVTWLAIGVTLDVVLAVLGATSDLGNNPDGMPWQHPLFPIAVLTATAGMFGYITHLVILLVNRWRDRAAWFLSRSQIVIWPSWTVGVGIFVLNVFIGWF